MHRESEPDVHECAENPGAHGNDGNKSQPANHSAIRGPEEVSHDQDRGCREYAEGRPAEVSRAFPGLGSCDLLGLASQRVEASAPIPGTPIALLALSHVTSVT